MTIRCIESKYGQLWWIKADLTILKMAVNMDEILEIREKEKIIRRITGQVIDVAGKNWTRKIYAIHRGKKEHAEKEKSIKTLDKRKNGNWRAVPRMSPVGPRRLRNENNNAWDIETLDPLSSGNVGSK